MPNPSLLARPPLPFVHAQQATQDTLIAISSNQRWAIMDCPLVLSSERRQAGGQLALYSLLNKTLHIWVSLCVRIWEHRCHNYIVDPDFLEHLDIVSFIFQRRDQTNFSSLLRLAFRVFLNPLRNPFRPQHNPLPCFVSSVLAYGILIHSTSHRIRDLATHSNRSHSMKHLALLIAGPWVLCLCGRADRMVWDS